MVRMVVALFAVLLVQAQLSKCNAFETLDRSLLHFDLQLQGATFDLLQGAPFRAARHKRSTADWTSFVPNLKHHREQLDMDSIEVASWFPLCSEPGNVKFESMTYQRNHYVFSVCGQVLTVYNATSASMSVLERFGLSGEVIAMRHTKIYDDSKAETVSHLLMLMSDSLDVFTFEKGRLEVLHSQDLLSEYIHMDTFYLESVSFILLAKKTIGDKLELGIFRYEIGNGDNELVLVVSKVFPETALLRMCVAGGRGYLFLTDSTGNTLSVYQFDKKSLDSHQIVSASGIQDLRCFNVGREYFVALVTSSSLIILRHVDGFYQIHQKEDGQGLESVISVVPRTYRDEAILILQGYDPETMKHFIDVFMLDGIEMVFRSILSRSCSHPFNWKLLQGSAMKVEGISCLTDGAVPDLSSSTALVMDKSVSLIIPFDLARSRVGLVLKMTTRLRYTRNPVLEQRDEIHRRVIDRYGVINSINQQSQDYASVVKGAILYGSDVSLMGSWSVGTLRASVIPVNNVSSQTEIWNHDVWRSYLDVPLTKVRRGVAEIEFVLKKLKGELDGAVQSGTWDTLYFDQLRVEGALMVRMLDADELIGENINGHILSQVLSTSVRKNSTQLIDGVKMMNGVLKTEHLEVSQINEIDVRDIVSRADKLRIGGDLFLGRGVDVGGDVLVNGTVDGIQMARELFVYDNVHQNLEFRGGLRVASLSDSGSLAGVDVGQDVLSTVVFNNSVGSVFRGVAEMDRLDIEGDLNIHSRSICGVNIVSLNSSVVSLDADQVIAADADLLMDVIVDGSLHIGGLFNELKIPEDLVFVDQKRVVMKGLKTFTKAVYAQQVSVHNFVNHHNVSQAIALDDDQVVVGSIILEQGFNGAQNVNVLKVNKVDYDKMRERGLHPSLLDVQPLHKDVVVRNSGSVSGILEVTLDVNGVQLDQVASDLIYADEREVVISGRKILPSYTVGQLFLGGRVNGLVLSRGLLTTSANQLIEGSYVIRNATFSSLNVPIINDYNLKEIFGGMVELENALQVLGGRLAFNAVVAEEIVVEGSINGVGVERLMIRAKNQSFQVPQVLASPRLPTFLVNEDVFFSGRETLNGVDVKRFENNRVTTSTRQVISANWKIANATFQFIKINSLNGLAMKEWSNSFLMKNSNAFLQGPLRVHGPLNVLGDVGTNRGINDYRLDVMQQVAGDLGQDISFDGLSLDRMSTTKISVAGKVNSHDLMSLDADVIYSSEPRRVVGTKRVRSLLVLKDVDAASINGGQLVGMYLSSGSDQPVHAPVHFSTLVTKDLSLRAGSLFNGVTSEDVFLDGAKHVNSYNGNVTIARPLRLGALRAKTVNGQDWLRLTLSLASIHESNSFQLPVTFQRPLEVKGSVSVHVIDGVDLNQFSKDVVLINEEAKIYGSKSFSKLSSSKVNSGSVPSAQTVPDILGTVNNSISLNGNGQKVAGVVAFDSVVVDGDVVVGDSLNGRQFPNEYVTLDTEQQLHGAHTIDRLILTGDITMAANATLNGFSVGRECNDTWMVDVDAELGTKMFGGRVSFKSDISVAGVANGFDLLGEVVRLDNDEILYGTPHMKRLIVNGQVRPSSAAYLTNNVDIGRASSRALYTDVPIETDARWSIESCSIYRQLSLDARTKVNGISLSNFVALNGSSVRAEKVVDRKMFRAALGWYETLRSAYFMIDYFELDQSISLPFEAVSSTQVRVGHVSILLVGTQHCSSFMYRRDALELGYSYVGVVAGTNSVTKWYTAKLGSTCYVSTLSKRSASCRKVGAKLWSVGTDGMHLVQDLGDKVSDVTMVTVGDRLVIYTIGSTVKRWVFSQDKVDSTDLSGGAVEYDKERDVIANSYKHRVLSAGSIIRSFDFRNKSMFALIENVDMSVGACPGVKIFSQHESSSQLEHVIAGCGVRHVIGFSAGNMPDDYLVLAEAGQVGVYQYTGSSGFVRAYSLPVDSATCLDLIELDNERLIVVCKQEKIIIFRAVFVGHYVGV